MNEKRHMAFLHEVGMCLVTGLRNRPIHVHHIRLTDFLFNTAKGVNLRPHWTHTAPILEELHIQELHGEKSDNVFWEDHGFPRFDLAKGPLAAAHILVGFSAIDDVDGARRWIEARALSNGTPAAYIGQT